MNIKFLGILMMAPQFTTFAYGVQLKILSWEADTYHHRIWSTTLTDKKMVESSLFFVSDEDKFDPTYVQPKKFHKFYKKVNREIENAYFQEFSKVCKNIFEESDQDKTKVAVYMLLEKVVEKSLKSLKSLKKLEDFKKKEDHRMSDTELKSALEYFLNIDKDKGVKTKK